jgi:hypothetical protein
MPAGHLEQARGWKEPMQAPEWQKERIAKMIVPEWCSWRVILLNLLISADGLISFDP